MKKRLEHNLGKEIFFFWNAKHQGRTKFYIIIITSYDYRYHKILMLFKSDLNQNIS